MGNFERYIKFLYHFTDTRNIPLIRESGYLFSLEQLRLRGIQVPVYGGDEGSRATDVSTGMDRFVHLCFDNSHPMEFRAKESGRIIESTFLRIDKSVLDRPGVLFTAGMANQNDIIRLNREQAEQQLDLECLFGGLNWREDSVKERRKIAKSTRFWSLISFR